MMDGQTDGQTSGWMDRWMDIQFSYTFPVALKKRTVLYIRSNQECLRKNGSTPNANVVF